MGSGQWKRSHRCQVSHSHVECEEQRCLDGSSIDDRCSIDSLASSFTSALTPANAIMAQPNCLIPRHTLSDGAMTTIMIPVVFS